MTINVAPDRSTLSLPGARLRPDLAGSRLDAPASAKDTLPADARAVTVSRGAPSELHAVRGLAAGLDRASSVADVALAATDVIKGLLDQLRELSASARNTGGQRGEAFNALVNGIAGQTDAAGFGGVNLLDGSSTEGGLRLPANLDGSGEITLTARDLRPGGPIVLVSPDQDPAAALEAVELSLEAVRSVREGLGEEAKRVDAHRTFVGRLSEAVAGDSGATTGVEGARLLALQLKQALSGQTLSVSNAGPQAVLSLFR
jgi:flagellin